MRSSIAIQIIHITYPEQIQETLYEDDGLITPNKYLKQIADSAALDNHQLVEIAHQTTYTKKAKTK